MRHRALIVLVLSGILGFRMGMVAFPDWQVAVETAQVLAGVVQYPHETPFLVYHTKLWTVLHQILAVGLRLGVSEIRLSLLVSGVIGMLSFQAIAMFVLALSESVLLAAFAPLVILLSRSTDAGVMYPIYLVGASHTYGAIGLSLFVLVVALLGAGRYRSGAFLLGLAPAVHPSLGFWLLVVVGAAFVWDFRQLRSAAGQAAWFFVAGCLVTLASLIVQLTGAYHAAPVDAGEAARHLSTFLQLWDYHRQPIPADTPGVILNGAALGMATLWLTVFAADIPRSSLFLLRIVVTASVLSLIVVAMSWIPPARLPTMFLILMPTRVANFNAMTFAPLLLGLVGAYGRRTWGWSLALLLSLTLAVNDRSMLWSWFEERGREPGLTALARFDLWLILEVAAAALVVLATLGALGVSSRWRRQPAGSSALESRWRRLTARGPQAVLATACAAMAVVGWQRTKPTIGIFENYTNSPLYRVASESHDVLVTGGGLHLIQLRTRRPVLLDGGGLDSLPYAPESGPAMARILADLYGVDFFDPPADVRHAAVVPSELNRAVWEQFSLERWKQLGDLYRFRQILTTADWSLQLPVVAQDRNLRLYQIPE